jgi:hypothetical protein
MQQRPTTIATLMLQNEARQPAEALDDAGQAELVVFEDVDEPDRAPVPGVGEHRPRALELLLMDRSERVVGEEVVAAEARVRVGARLHER